MIGFYACLICSQIWFATGSVWQGLIWTGLTIFALFWETRK